MHSQCTAPNHVYKDVDTGQVASDLVSCIEPQSLPDSLESSCFHRVFPYVLNRDLNVTVPSALGLPPFDRQRH
jgi:hypothetical protein